MSTYAIGDLQGCYEELQELLLSFKFNEDRDCLWFCGDLVNRGPESLKCLSYLHSIKDNCKIVLGNHDIHLLAVVDGKRKLSESDTFIDVLESSNLSTLKNWMMTLPFHYIESIETKSKKEEYIMTHAGVPPTWTKADLENFLRRWEEMKDAAETGTPESKKKYEKSLRSLGLRPKSGSRKTKTVEESAEGLGQDSAVNRPPAERVPDFNSFMRDLNRANDN